MLKIAFQIQGFRIYEAKTGRTDKTGRTEKSATVIGFTIPFSVIGRLSGQKISKDIKDLNNTINQLDLIDIYRTLYPPKNRTHILSDNIYPRKTYSG